MTEDEIISKLFKPIAGPLGFFLDDDAAFLPHAKGRLVVTTDALVAGVHFFQDDPPALIAKKALRVNLSDLAAKGATPRFFTLTLCLPRDWEQGWLVAFAAGLKEDADAYGCRLIGGDTTATPGPLTISITAFGDTEAGDKYVARKGAAPRDAIYVSGPIGDAALGLALRRNPVLAAKLSQKARDHLLERYLLPHPRVALITTIRAQASAAMDVSDGLAGDLAKLCRASGVSARVEIAAIPFSEAAHEAIALEPALLETAITGGDDYEILCCASGALAGFTKIGEILAGSVEPAFLDARGAPKHFRAPSFSHF